MKRRDLLVMASLGLASSFHRPTGARVAGTNLPSLVLTADLILIAKVEELIVDNRVTLARVAPKRSLKGEPPPGLFFIAQPTWACDTSQAFAGEGVLLFLEKSKSQHVGFKGQSERTGVVKSRPLYALSHSGRGRMVIETVRGQVGVTASTYALELPASLPRIKRTTVDADSSLRTVPLAAMENAVRREVAAQRREFRR